MSSKKNEQTQKSKFKFGRRFNLPRIGKWNKNVTPSIKISQGLEMFPKLPNGEKHTLPFYMMGEVTLPTFSDPPWKEALEQDKAEMFWEFCVDPQNVRYFRNTFLTEALKEEILAVASLSITETKNKKVLDKETEVFMEEEIFLPTVQREVFVCVWELLYDWGRNLTQQQFKGMQSREHKLKMISEDSKEILSSRMLEGFNTKSSSKENFTEEKKLSGELWEVLLYNYACKLQQNSFKRNVSFHILQEKLVTEGATQEISEGLLFYLEKDMTQLDEREKTNNPPRAG